MAIATTADLPRNAPREPSCDTSMSPGRAFRVQCAAPPVVPVLDRSTHALPRVLSLSPPRGAVPQPAPSAACESWSEMPSAPRMHLTSVACCSGASASSRGCSPCASLRASPSALPCSTSPATAARLTPAQHVKMPYESVATAGPVVRRVSPSPREHGQPLPPLLAVHTKGSFSPTRGVEAPTVVCQPGVTQRCLHRAVPPVVSHSVSPPPQRSSRHTAAVTAGALASPAGAVRVVEGLQRAVVPAGPPATSSGPSTGHRQESPPRSADVVAALTVAPAAAGAAPARPSCGLLSPQPDARHLHRQRQQQPRQPPQRPHAAAAPASQQQPAPRAITEAVCKYEQGSAVLEKEPSSLDGSLQRVRGIETVKEEMAFDAARAAASRPAQTIEVAGKLGALEATVMQARAHLAHLGVALMAEQPHAVKGCPGEDRPPQADSLCSSASVPDLSGRGCRGPDSAAMSRTTVDTCILEGSLRKELSANLQEVRERIQAVSNECMQELFRAQIMLGGSSANSTNPSEPCGTSRQSGLGQDRSSSAPPPPPCSDMSQAMSRSMLLRTGPPQIAPPNDPAAANHQSAGLAWVRFPG